MIKEQDLLEAIAECQGERTPNANTCIKLAAYYTILNNIKPDPAPSYSHAEPPGQVRYDSGSEFSEAIEGRDIIQVLAIIDELMDALQAIAPKMYQATIKALTG